MYLPSEIFKFVCTMSLSSLLFAMSQTIKGKEDNSTIQSIPYTFLLAILVACNMVEGFLSKKKTEKKNKIK